MNIFIVVTRLMDQYTHISKTHQKKIQYLYLKFFCYYIAACRRGGMSRVQINTEKHVRGLSVKMIDNIIKD